MLKGSDIIKKKYQILEEKFRTYVVAVQTQIEILKRTITKFKGKLEEEETLLEEAMNMTVEEFTDKHQKGELSVVYPHKK